MCWSISMFTDSKCLSTANWAPDKIAGHTGAKTPGPDCAHTASRHTFIMQRSSCFVFPLVTVLFHSILDKFCQSVDFYLLFLMQISLFYEDFTSLWMKDTLENFLMFALKKCLVASNLIQVITSLLFPAASFKSCTLEIFPECRTPG